MSIVLAGTGHRPQRLGGFNQSTYDRLDGLALDYLSKHTEVSKVISGMALGWDFSLARMALELCIPLVAAVPFEGQELTWELNQQKEYRRLLKLADEVVIVSSGGYMPQKLHLRNFWMVDNCDQLLALWNGVPKGGTAKTVAYAHLKRKPVIQLWSNFKAL